CRICRRWHFARGSLLLRHLILPHDITHNDGDRRTGGRDAPPARRDSAMRFATNLFATLVLAGALANAAQAQPGITTPAPGPYSVDGPGQTSWRDFNYKMPTSVYCPSLTYRQLDYRGPYSGRLSSAPSPAQTRTTPDPSLRTAGMISQTGNGRGLGGDATRPDAGRAAATGGEPG